MNKQQKQVERITKEIKKKFQTGYGLNVVSVRTNNKFFYVYLKGCQEIANKRTELDLEKRMFEGIKEMVNWKATALKMRLDNAEVSTLN